jgi:hypothetical protein
MSRNNKFSTKDKPVTIAGHCRLRITTVSIASPFYAQTLSVSPVDSSIGRLIAISDSFDLYRFTRLRFRLLPSLVGGAGADGCLAFVPTNPSAYPASLNDLVEAEDSVYFWGQQTVPAQLNVSPATLKGGVPVWYKTRAISSIPDLFEYQGALTVGDESGASRVYTIYMDYVITFKCPIGVSQTGFTVPRPLASLPRAREMLESKQQEPISDEEYQSVTPKARRPKR